jgi:hypothetical protein
MNAAMLSVAMLSVLVLNVVVPFSNGGGGGVLKAKPCNTMITISICVLLLSQLGSQCKLTPFYSTINLPH